MRLLLPLAAIAMPVVAWLSNAGAFGPDNGTISARYPTLLVAAGYAFSIWGLVFLLDAIYAAWQATGWRRHEATLARVAPWAATGFVLTTAWMPLFSQEWFWPCLAVILGATACLVRCALLLSRDRATGGRSLACASIALSLHAGWLTLASFLNLAQVVVAFELLPTADQLPWSMVLWGAAAIVLLVLNHRMRGNPVFVAAVLWGLVAVCVRQSGHALAGAEVSAWISAALAIAIALQTVMLRRDSRNRRALASRPLSSIGP